MIGILTAYPTTGLVTLLREDGAEFFKDRTTGIWRGTTFKIFSARTSHDAGRLAGHVFTDIACFGHCNSECVSYARTRVDRHG
jgi:hypothetical protein